MPAPATWAGASIERMSVASPEQYLANLNPAQREAVLHTEGPLLVIAGAGSGKTRVLTHRVAHLTSAIGVKPNEILAITFTNKAAGEMRERLTAMLGPMARAIWILTFHAACGRMLRREAERLGYKSNFTIYDSADQVRLVKQVPGGTGQGPEALRSARRARADLERQEPADHAGQVRRADRFLLRPDDRRGLRALPEEAGSLERGRLRRHADADRADPGELPGRAEALAELVPLRDGRRVPGHEPRAVPAAAAAGRAPPQHLRGRRPRPVDLRLPRCRHPQHPRVRARLPGDAHDPARAELPLHERDPRGRERGHLAQLGAEGQAALVGARRGRPRPCDRGRGRAVRVALRRRPDRRPRRGGLLRQRDRGLLPNERAVARARADAATAPDRVPGDRRAALLRARRGQGRDRVPAGSRQPGRRRQPDADHKPPEARDRRHDDLAARSRTPTRTTARSSTPSTSRPRPGSARPPSRR